MRNSWKDKLESFLRDGMRYCFPQGTSFAELSEEEFMGDGSLGGFYHSLESFINSLRKQVFFKAYSLGVQDCLSDLGKTDTEFSENVSRIGAERRWLETERD